MGNHSPTPTRPTHSRAHTHTHSHSHPHPHPLTTHPATHSLVAGQPFIDCPRPDSLTLLPILCPPANLLTTHGPTTNLFDISLVGSPPSWMQAKIRFTSTLRTSSPQARPNAFAEASLYLSILDLLQHRHIPSARRRITKRIASHLRPSGLQLAPVRRTVTLAD